MKSGLLDLSIRKKGSLLILLLFIVFAGCENKVQEELSNNAKTYKNVIVIVGDDHSYKALGSYGNEVVQTPNLDKLADQGVKFTNAYSNAPICSASRQSLLTGKYPHATGVNLLFTPFNDHTNTTIAEHLKKEGFATALIGKGHLNSFVWYDLYKNGMPTFGFDTMIDSHQYRQWLESHPPQPIPNSIHTFDDPTDLDKKFHRVNTEVLPQPCYDKDCQGTFLTNEAIRYIEDNKDNRFFLWLAFHEPHAPFDFPIEYAGKYGPEDITLPEGSPEDDQWVPERFKGFTDQQKKGVIASYYTSVEYLDKNIGLVMNALKEKGLDENTLIIYLGDQGYLLYDHKRFEKHTMWKEAIKSPLIIKGAGLPQNKTYDELIEFIDVAPFVCNALGIKPMNETQGKSFYDLLNDPKNYQEKDYVFAEFLEDNKAMVANKNWKYIFTTGRKDLGMGYATGNEPPGILHRLYNFQEDPGETKNVAYNPENRPVLKKMREVMLEKFKSTHPCADELPGGLTIDGKLVWFCEPRDVGAGYDETPQRIFYRKEQIK